MTLTAGAGSARLPVFSLVARAGRMAVRGGGDLARLAWPWLLLVAPLLFAFHWAEREYVPVLAGELPEWLVGKATEALRYLIQVPFLAPLAAAWQRLLLIGERPKGWWNVRYDGVVRRYVLAVLQLLAVAWALGLAIEGLQLIPAGHAAITLPAAVLGFAGLFGGLFILARSGLRLPALALDRRDVSWRDVLALTRARNLEIAGGFLLCLAPNILLYRLVEAFAPERTAVMYGLAHAGYHLANGLLLLLAAGFLALAYQKLTEPPKPSEEPTMRLQPGPLAA